MGLAVFGTLEHVAASDLELISTTLRIYICALLVLAVDMCDVLPHVLAFAINATEASSWLLPYWSGMLSAASRSWAIGWQWYFQEGS